MNSETSVCIHKYKNLLQLRVSMPKIFKCIRERNGSIPGLSLLKDKENSPGGEPVCLVDKTDTNITESMGKDTPTNPIQHSGYVPLDAQSSLFFVSSPLQNIVTSLSFPSSSSFPVSLLCPLLLDLHVVFLLSGCENLLWQERQREGHG